MPDSGTERSDLMAFSKTIFVDNQTVIDTDALNAIQDELIWVGADKSMGLSGLAADDQIMVSAVDNSGNLSAKAFTQ